MYHLHHTRLVRLLPLGALFLTAALMPWSAPLADDADCVVCHEPLVGGFGATIHGRIATWETAAGHTGCSTCHGDGAEHVDNGGEGGIISLKADMRPEAISEVCITCHATAELNDWIGSEHPLNDVGCTDCHVIHEQVKGPIQGNLTTAVTDLWDPIRSRTEKSPAVCIGCHAETWAQFQYPSHHPVREGHMNCVSCHQPHGTSFSMLKTEMRSADLCLSCHADLQGPWMFEHEPVQEGCETCHSPHGSVANNLLTQAEPMVCLQCHDMHFHAGLEAEEDDEFYVQAFDPDFDSDVDRPTYPGGMVPNPWGSEGYKQAFTTKCTQCHTRVHGSDLPSQTVPGRGGGLMR